MRLKMVFFIFFVSSIIYAYDLGEDLFPKNVETYFVSNNQNYFEIESLENEEREKNFLKYSELYNIDIRNVLESGVYSMASYDNIGGKSFVLMKKISVAEYINSSFYNNSNFEKEYLEDLNVNYVIGENQFAYLYYKERLYISNNINLFFKTINALKIKADTVSEDENYQKIMYDKNYSYKIYSKTDGNNQVYHKGYIYSSEIKKENLLEKRYILEDYSDEHEELREQKYNFSDYIINSPDRVYIGKSIDYLKEILKKDFEILNEFEFDKTEEIIKKNLKTLIYVEKDNEYYMVLKGFEKWGALEVDIKNLYEENYMKGLNKLELIKTDYGYEFKLPLTRIKKDLGLKNKEYFIIASNEEFLKDIMIGKYYNYEYSEISSSKEIYRDYIDNEIGEYKIVNGILIESIDVENKE